MNVKKMSIVVSTALLLVACGKDEVVPEKVKEEQKASAADIARKQIKASREKKLSADKKADSTTEEKTQEVVTTEAVQKENVNNITNRNTLSQIIYSNNYTAAEKMAAYQSGVANGVIPQGTNTSSPAAAFESALQVELNGAQTQATTETPAIDPNTGLPVQQ
ncbi:hypothetical protein ACMGE6_02350 [Macrococcus equi]|uniref:hypothetical protein n=1 Tax=Macrococcus equi TaxID=3395462 RepID=UPI0039BDA9DD